ncbi:hypothetical protein FPV67DRAFT_223606 [Lyophyllum atratum]|nr:hypothetical protein FPV67DRAFT_223606 [Lyophyllum atratum]
MSWRPLSVSNGSMGRTASTIYRGRIRIDDHQVLVRTSLPLLVTYIQTFGNMHCALFLATLAAFSTLVGASPLEARQPGCHPNFEGVGVSVVWDQSPFAIREFVPGDVGANITTTINEFQQTAEFRFEQTGAFPARYIAKKLGVPANNMVIGSGTSVTNNQFLNIEYYNSNDPTQVWDVTCDVCGTNAWSLHGMFASGCTIKSSNLGLCAQVVTSVPRAHTAPSFLLQLVSCNGAAPNQKYQFWMA